METVILKHYCKLHMISKNKIKQIKSLTQKKFRQQEQLFLVEGDKIVLEVLNSPYEIKELFAKDLFISENKNSLTRAGKVTEASHEEIKKASLLKHPQNCLALCILPSRAFPPFKLSGISLYLEGVQDPGNLGTIIRICDWFGMEYLFCSPDTADFFNPKVIQSSMGSFCHVKPVYIEFDELSQLASKSEIPIIGTFADGHNLYNYDLPENALIILGNEGRGIREHVLPKIDIRLGIPSLQMNKSRAQSLNVAVAAGIISSEFRRQNGRFSIRNENKG
jgi:RNA methyltransferase, TrmH family